MRDARAQHEDSYEFCFVQGVVPAGNPVHDLQPRPAHKHSNTGRAHALAIEVMKAETRSCPIECSTTLSYRNSSPPTRS